MLPVGEAELWPQVVRDEQQHVVRARRGWRLPRRRWRPAAAGALGVAVLRRAGGQRALKRDVGEVAVVLKATEAHRRQRPPAEPWIISEQQRTEARQLTIVRQRAGEVVAAEVEERQCLWQPAQRRRRAAEAHLLVDAGAGRHVARLASELQ